MVMLQFAVYAMFVAAPILSTFPAADIRLPVAPKIDIPPAPPTEISKLKADQFYVIDADAPVIVLSSPLGFVKVTEEAGPIKVRGRFVDGTGVETRTFKGKHVYIVEAVQDGKIELILVPDGAKTEKDAIRRNLNVETGIGPQPPPDAPADPILANVQAAYTADTSTTKAADKAALRAVYAATADALADVKTAGDLFGVISGATKARIGDRLKPARTIFGTELEKFLPSDPSAVLTANQKAEARKQLQRFADLLEKVK